LKRGKGGEETCKRGKEGKGEETFPRPNTYRNMQPTRKGGGKKETSRSRNGWKKKGGKGDLLTRNPGKKDPAKISHRRTIGNRGA